MEALKVSLFERHRRRADLGLGLTVDPWRMRVLPGPWQFRIPEDHTALVFVRTGVAILKGSGPCAIVPSRHLTLVHQRPLVIQPEVETLTEVAVTTFRCCTALDRFDGAWLGLSKGHPQMALQITPEAIVRQVLAKLFLERFEAMVNLPGSSRTTERAYANLLAQRNAVLTEPTLTVNDMAREAGLLRGRFTRCFKIVFGQSPKQCVDGVRLARASSLLSHSPLPVSDIAAMCGFEYRSSFSRAFHQNYHVSPAAFRKLRHVSCHDSP